MEVYYEKLHRYRQKIGGTSARESADPDVRQLQVEVRELKERVKALEALVMTPSTAPSDSPLFGVQGEPMPPPSTVHEDTPLSGSEAAPTLSVGLVVHPHEEGKDKFKNLQSFIREKAQEYHINVTFEEPSKAKVVLCIVERDARISGPVFGPVAEKARGFKKPVGLIVFQKGREDFIRVREDEISTLGGPDEWKTERIVFRSWQQALTALGDAEERLRTFLMRHV